MKISITKLMAIEINLFQAAIYYYTYMIKSAYFGYRIIDLAMEQELVFENLQRTISNQTSPQ